MEKESTKYYEESANGASRKRHPICVKLSKKSTINLTTSKDVAEKSLNKRVMNSVIEQIATEQNERAVELRDKGKIKEAKKVGENPLLPHRFFVPTSFISNVSLSQTAGIEKLKSQQQKNFFA